jgi:hypothetical protein
MLGPPKPRRVEEPIATDSFVDASEPTDEPLTPPEDGLLRLPANTRDADDASEERALNRWNLLEVRRLDPKRPAKRGYRHTSDVGVRLDLLWRVRFRRRGLENVNIEGLLIATGQNLKRFLAATGWGRRHASCGSLLAVPREPRWLLSVYPRAVS